MSGGLVGGGVVGGGVVGGGVVLDKVRGSGAVARDNETVAVVIRMVAGDLGIAGHRLIAAPGTQLEFAQTNPAAAG